MCVIKGWGYKVTCIRKSTYKLKEKAKDVYEYMSGNLSKSYKSVLGLILDVNWSDIDYCSYCW